jgi:hypothetical protein
MRQGGGHFPAWLGAQPPNPRKPNEKLIGLHRIKLLKPQPTLIYINRYRYKRQIAGSYSVSCWLLADPRDSEVAAPSPSWPGLTWLDPRLSGWILLGKAHGIDSNHFQSLATRLDMKGSAPRRIRIRFSATF